MDRLRKACEGKSQAEGGMNLPEIRAVATLMGHSGYGNRHTLVKVICENLELIDTEALVASGFASSTGTFQRYSSQGILMDETVLESLKRSVMTPTPHELEAGQEEKAQLITELATNRRWPRPPPKGNTPASNVGLLDSLDKSTLRFVMDQMDYPTLISLSKTNKELNALVQARFNGQAANAIAKLKLPSDTNKSELVEKLYHLNEYQSGDCTGITIKSYRDYYLWFKGACFIAIYHDGTRETWKTSEGFSRLMGPAVQDWRNGVKVSEEWYLNGKLHRIDGPARQTWRDSGFKTEASWYYQGKLHRKGGPAQELRDDRGHEYNWYINDQRHRIDGPAQIRMSLTDKYNTYTETWYKWDKIHRLDGPAMYKNTTDIGETFVWYREGTVHRDLEPAIYESNISSTGNVKVQVFWIDNGRRHRLNGPAYLGWIDGIFYGESWMKEDKYDRSDGAAKIWFQNGTKHMEYMRNGVPITKQQLSDNLVDF